MARRWITAAWRAYLRAAEDGAPLERDVADALAGADPLAVSQLTVTSAAMLRPFHAYNAAHPGREVRPFGFLLAAHVRRLGHPLGVDPTSFQLVAAFGRDARAWSQLPWRNRHPTVRKAVRTAATLQDALRAVATAEQAWETLRTAVLNAGGLSPGPGAPSRSIPPAVRRRAGRPAEAVATDLGYPDGASLLAALGQACEDLGAARATLEPAPATREEAGAPFRVTTRSGGAAPDVAKVVTVREVLAGYPYHADAKFLAPDGGPVTRSTVGHLRLRTVIAGDLHYIGKEANRLEERSAGLLHDRDEAQTEFTPVPDPTLPPHAIAVLRTIPQAMLAEAASVETRHVRRILAGTRLPGAGVRTALLELAATRAREQLAGAGADPPAGDEALLAAWLGWQAGQQRHCLGCDGLLPAGPRQRQYCSERCAARVRQRTRRQTSRAAST